MFSRKKRCNMNKRVLSVSDINSHVKNLLEDDYILRSVFIKGEISNFTHHSSGHMYFTLKDKQSAVSAVMFRGSASGLSFAPKVGMKVLVRASASIYEKTGRYQLYIYDMEQIGKGALHEQFEKLKIKLEKEGLFDPLTKPDIPAFPKSVGVITSETGAAIRDIINVLNRRNPTVKIYVHPVLVQGDNAAPAIIEAIETMNKHTDCDVLIVGRGGGSIEDLWAFNEEKVARAIFDSKIPIISAVGHETDFTIADFVASLRAPTPSAAAELGVPNITDLQREVNNYRERTRGYIVKHLNHQSEVLKMYKSRPVLANASEMFTRRAQDVDLLEGRLKDTIEKLLTTNKSNLSEGVAKLKALSPLNTLDRGYGLVLDDKEQIISSAKQVEKGQDIEITLKDGEISAKVN